MTIETVGRVAIIVEARGEYGPGITLGIMPPPTGEPPRREPRFTRATLTVGEAEAVIAALEMEIASMLREKN